MSAAFGFELNTACVICTSVGAPFMCGEDVQFVLSLLAPLVAAELEPPELTGVALGAQPDASRATIRATPTTRNSAALPGLEKGL